MEEAFFWREGVLLLSESMDCGIQKFIFQVIDDSGTILA